MLRRLVILAITLLAVATAAEVVVRVAGWTPNDALLDPSLRARIDGQRIVKDPALLFRMAGNPITCAGVPGRTLDTGDRDRRLRVVLCGGRMASGADVATDDSIGARLERQLQRELPGARVEVAMLGVPGHSTAQSARLLQRHLTDLQADLVVICCEVTADAARVAATDAEAIAMLIQPPRLHLQRAWQLWRRPAADPQAPRRRVPTEETKRNVEWMIDAARRAGAEAWVCVAPYPITWDAENPALLDYTRTVTETANGRSSVLLETEETTRAYQRSLEGLPLCAEVGSSHGFWQGEQLSQPGSLLVAELIANRIRALPRYGALVQRTADPALRLERIQPTSVAALTASDVEVFGAGLDGQARVWVGDRNVATQPIAGGVRAKLPIDLMPGVHEVAVSTPRGLVAGMQLTVTAPPLQVTSVADFSGIRLTISGQAPAGAKLRLLTAPVANTTAEATPAGPFWLRYLSRQARWNHAPFCFANLPLEQVEATAAQDGTFSASLRPTVEAGQLNLAVQGVIWLPGEPPHGVTTELAVHQLSK